MKKLIGFCLTALIVLPALAAPPVSMLAAPVRPAASATPPAAPLRTLLQPGKSPLVSFRILLQSGAAQDPPGKEGVAALTAAMLSEAGTRTLTYEQVIAQMYPLATTFSAQVDKEMTAFYGTTHRDNLDTYYSLISTMLLEPGWRQSDFERLKNDAITYLKTDLVGDNDEELAKEFLYNSIYRGHPYGHHDRGRLDSVQKLTLDDVKAFYHQHYLASNLTVGLAGGYPKAFPTRLDSDLRKLGGGQKETPVALPQPQALQGRQLTLLQKDTRSTAFSLGFPILINRSHPDFPALWFATMWLGEHRSDNSHLYQRLRELRGLNYGDYAYIEYFPRGSELTEPDPNQARRQQIFQIWIRPVEPVNAHFALRNVIFELDKFVTQGLPPQDFEVTRQYLSRYVNLLVKSQDTRLGYALDSQYYGIPEFAPYMALQLEGLTLEKVNAVIRKYLSCENLQIVGVAANAAELAKAISEDAPSPIHYNAAKPAEVLSEDKLIQVLPLKLPPDHIRIVGADQAFR